MKHSELDNVKAALESLLASSDDTEGTAKMIADLLNKAIEDSKAKDERKEARDKLASLVLRDLNENNLSFAAAAAIATIVLIDENPSISPADAREYMKMIADAIKLGTDMFVAASNPDTPIRELIEKFGPKKVNVQVKSKDSDLDVEATIKKFLATEHLS